MRHGSKSALLPLFPSKQTFADAIGMSVEGHERTHALKQMASLFDYLVGA